MTQETSLVKRLCEAKSPYSLYDWEDRDGYYVAACRVSAEDIPELIDIARQWTDTDRPSDTDGPDIDREKAALLPVTAWRALADLKAVAAVGPLVDILRELDGAVDDWVGEDLPHVFGKVGESAIEALDCLARDTSEEDFVRTVALSGLRYVADYHADTRDRIIASLTELMAGAADESVDFNTMLLVELVELRAVEAAEPIERAFAGNLIDVGMVGDWEAVRQQLGVEGLGLEMPENPHDSIKRLRESMGIGTFSVGPIFIDGDVDEDAERSYYDRAYETFSKSPEAQQVVDRHGDLGWSGSLLEFGIHYLGQIVNEMTLGSVKEFVLEHVPRKFSIEPDQAASLVFELAMFWEYLDRVHKLPEAKRIAQWLETDGLVAEVEAELSDPSNYGLAKSMFMSGKNAGFDMTSEAGLAEFMAAYNESLASDEPPAAGTPAAGGPIARGPRVGRNDPCPCGSGKKFKKCCR